MRLYTYNDLYRQHTSAEHVPIQSRCVCALVVIEQLSCVFISYHIYPRHKTISAYIIYLFGMFWVRACVRAIIVYSYTLLSAACVRACNKVIELNATSPHRSATLASWHTNEKKTAHTQTRWSAFRNLQINCNTHNEHETKCALSCSYAHKHTRVHTHVEWLARIRRHAERYTT